MIYAYTQDNIKALLQAVGTLEEGQLVKFFSNELQPIRVKYLLNELVLNHEIKFDEQKRTYSWLGTPKLIDEVYERRILAFWAIAGLGSNAVMDIDTPKFPVQFLVYGKDSGETYDYSVIESEPEARLAARVIYASLLPGVKDDIRHIAVLRRESDLKKLKSALIECGFDCAVSIDYMTKDITYYPFE